MSKIFDTIRAQANLKKAESIRSGDGVNLRDRCAEETRKQMAGFGDTQLDAFVDVFLGRCAGYAIAECRDVVPEIAGDGEEAAQARKAMTEAAVMSGQYFKGTVKGALKGIIDNMHVRVADTIATVATEATIESLIGVTRQLPEGGKDN